MKFLKTALKEMYLRAKTEYYFKKHPDYQQKHFLKKELIVSLTSYPPRFSTLPLTLKCLLAQDVKPDRVILWIAEEDFDKLPNTVQNLEEHGLVIKSTKNIRSYKKLIPALKEYPEAIIVTADDDVYYPPNWLRLLIEEWDEDQKTIVCHRAHIIITNDRGLPISYRDWLHAIKGKYIGADIFPTGIGGILYPPKSLLYPEVLNEKIFLDLAPYGDDIWFFFMGKLNDARYIKTSFNENFYLWMGTQKVALWKDNLLGNLNDIQIKKMIDFYGWK